jgi:alpha-L-fucosidase
MYKSLLLLIWVSILSHRIYSQDVVPSDIKTPDSILQSFMDKRFGLFVHWGPVTLRGTEIGWSRNHQVTQSDYDSLYKEFNPVLFNADEWVRIAKNAGVKYLTITAKHHDGFCLWPSAFTKYNISNTPYKKDIVGQLATACKKYGIKFCIYYSVLDWYNPDYPSHNDGKKTPDPNADMSRYIIYMKNQLRELITTYHPYMLWFDGNWESPWTQQMAVAMYTYIKSIDRKVIINNRLGKTDHKSITAETVGDYATPEQEIGAINMNDPWESCITICHQWSWKPNDEMKSFSQCIRTLSRTAGGNGNLLLNVGPMPDGRIEARQSKRLEEIGNWLQKNGVAIYNTRCGPYKPDSVFSSTRKGNKIFLHLYSNNQSSLNISSIPGMKVQRAYFLEGGKINFTESGSKIALSWTGDMPDPVCSIIVIEMNDRVDSIPLL